MHSRIKFFLWNLNFAKRANTYTKRKPRVCSKGTYPSFSSHQNVNNLLVYKYWYCRLILLQLMQLRLPPWTRMIFALKSQRDVWFMNAMTRPLWQLLRISYQSLNKRSSRLRPIKKPTHPNTTMSGFTYRPKHTHRTKRVHHIQWCTW